MRLNKVFFSIFLCILSFSQQASLNTHGVTGFFNTPTAMMGSEGKFQASFFYGYPDKKIFLSSSPFNWLEASLFYTSIENKPYVAYNSEFIFENQSYKDKGFNFKINLKNETIFSPAISMGFNDIGGTGLYSSEYIVASKNYERLMFNLGIGFGKYNSGATLSNPLGLISDQFKNRGSYSSGELNAKTFFTGKNAALFGGVRYKFNEHTHLFLELDPTDFNSDIDYEGIKDNDRLNLGFTRNINDFNLRAYYANNNKFLFQITYMIDGKKFDSNPLFIKNSKKPKKVTDIRKELEKNGIGLKQYKENLNKQHLEVRQTSYSDSRIVDSRVLNILNQTNSHKETIVSQYFLGMKMTEVSSQPYSNRKINAVESFSISEDEQVSEDIFPIINQGFSIKPRFFTAAREGFFHQGIFVEHDSEIVIKENLLFSSNIKFPISSNFEDLYIEPVDTYPNQVRSDTKKYLNSMDKSAVIGRLQFDYFKNYKSNYYHLSVGVLEEMFNGIHYEHVISPQNLNLSYGYELMYLKKRDYRMLFGSKDYSNLMFRSNFLYEIPSKDVFLKLSAGEYLAGDKGFTFEVSRRFDNGVQAGIFFTKTDVSKELYGEGSFDKGIRVIFPFPSLTGNFKKNLTQYTWRPLTKDPGSLLIRKVDLLEDIQRYRR